MSPLPVLLALVLAISVPGGSRAQGGGGDCAAQYTQGAGTASNCQACLLSSGCKFCDGAGSRWWGCVEVANNTVCQHEDDSFKLQANSCPDNCLGGSEQRDCRGCLKNGGVAAGCGFCQDGAGCRTGTAQGPWSAAIPNCADWRWGAYDSYNCAPFLESNQETCADMVSCGQCAGARYNSTLDCVWCGDAEDNQKGSCVEKSLGVQCSAGLKMHNESSACPPDASDATKANLSSMLALACTAALSSLLS